jgi:tetratricopeptide (TPR) repeat protein
MDLFSPLLKNEKHVLDKAEELLAKARSHDGERALEEYFKTLEFLSSKHELFEQYKPNFAMIYVQTGWELIHRAHTKEGLGCFNMALNLDPENPSLWNEKGLAFCSLKQYDDALRAYERALSINHDDGGAWVNKGDALKALGRPDEAIKAYEESLKHSPSNIDVFNRMLEVHPMDATVHHRKGQALARAARP